MPLNPTPEEWRRAREVVRQENERVVRARDEANVMAFQRELERLQAVTGAQAAEVRLAAEAIARGIRSVQPVVHETAQGIINAFAESFFMPQTISASIERGCRRRIAGGIYWETAIGPLGNIRWQDVLCDPPIPIDIAELGVTNVGVRLIERNGVTHVLDVIGSHGYPNVADFIEEARRFGVSRRLSSSLDFSVLTRESKLLAIHCKAMVKNWSAYRPYRGVSLSCPCGHAEHRVGAQINIYKQYTGMCAGIWWEDVVGGEPVRETNAEIVRQMPWGSYRARARSEGRYASVMPEYQHAIFAKFPLTNLAIVSDPENPEHTRQTRELMRQQQVPVALRRE
jgi:hypothetical protein